MAVVTKKCYYALKYFKAYIIFISTLVHEPIVIRKEVEKQQQVMRRLESKRDYLDAFEISNGSKGKSEEDLHARIGVLREMCNVIKHRVISRKSECTAMASDSEQFARKLNEIDSWLSRLDGIYQSTYPLGQTLDILGMILNKKSKVTIFGQKHYKKIPNF